MREAGHCRLIRRSLLVLVGACVLWHAPLATAQTVPADSATRRAARQLAEEGGELFDEGRYAEAQDRLRRAYELVPAPTIAVLEAEALVRLGRLVDAAERYEAAGRFTLTKDSSEAFRQAVKTAENELEKIRARIPQLIVVVQGASGSAEGLQVVVDGKPVPPALLGMRRPTDPGQHQVVASLPGGLQDARWVTLAEGEQKRVVLVLEQPKAATTTTEPAHVAEVAPDRPRDGSTQRLLGWIGLGVGGAGLTTGAVAGLVMLGKKSKLEDSCVPQGDVVACPESSQDDLDAYRSSKTISWIGYSVGVVGAGVGAVLLLTAPRAPAQDATARITPWIGPAQVGISGRF